MDEPQSSNPLPSEASPGVPVATGDPAILPGALQGQFVFPGFPTATTVQQVQVWQGQFPPPDAIERYVAVQPDAFDRILRMAEIQQQAIIEGSAEARLFQRYDVRRAHWLGFAVTGAAMIGAAFCAAQGQTAVALALVGVPVLSVAKALIDSVTIRKQVEIQSKAVEQASDTTEPPSD